MWIINACSTSISSYPCRSLSDEKYSPGNTNHIKRKKSPSTLLIICFSSFFGGHMKPCCPLIGWSLSSRLLEHAPQRLVTYFDVCVCVYLCESVWLRVLWASEHCDMLLARGTNPSHYNPAIGYDRKSFCLAPTHPPQPGTTGPALCEQGWTPVSVGINQISLKARSSATIVKKIQNHPTL